MIIDKSKGEFQDLPDDLDAFFRDASIPIMILKQDRFVYANPETIRELNYSSSSDFPMENPERISPQFQPDGELSRLKARRMLALAKETGSARFEWMHRRATGEDFVSEVILTPVQSGEVDYTIATWTDISNRWVQKKERAQLAKRAETALKTQAIAELASGMAHDLTNFLQVTIGYIQLAENGSDGRPAEYCRHALESVKQARDLIHRIMAVGQDEGDAPTVICLNDFLEEMKSLLQMIVGARLELFIELPAERLSVLANKGRLERSILNLVSNANDATDDGGSILVALRRTVADDKFCDAHRWAVPGHYAVIDVVDDGVGIEQENQQRIFEPFYSNKRRTSGTGLGLSSVASSFAEMGGGVALLSNVGSGSTFTCYLPLAGSSRPT